MFTGAGQELSSQLASELGRQRRLYDDLLDKTQQIQSVCVYVCVGVCVGVCLCVWARVYVCVCVFKLCNTTYCNSHVYFYMYTSTYYGRSVIEHVYLILSIIDGG